MVISCNALRYGLPNTDECVEFLQQQRGTNRCVTPLISFHGCWGRNIEDLHIGDLANECLRVHSFTGLSKQPIEGKNLLDAFWGSKNKLPIRGIIEGLAPDPGTMGVLPEPEGETKRSTAFVGKIQHITQRLRSWNL